MLDETETEKVEEAEKRRKAEAEVTRQLRSAGTPEQRRAAVAAAVRQEVQRRVDAEPGAIDAAVAGLLPDGDPDAGTVMALAERVAAALRSRGLADDPRGGASGADGRTAADAATADDDGASAAPQPEPPAPVSEPPAEAAAALLAELARVQEAVEAEVEAARTREFEDRRTDREDAELRTALVALDRAEAWAAAATAAEASVETTRQAAAGTVAEASVEPPARKTAAATTDESSLETPARKAAAATTAESSPKHPARQAARTTAESSNDLPARQTATTASLDTARQAAAARVEAARAWAAARPSAESNADVRQAQARFDALVASSGTPPGYPARPTAVRDPGQSTETPMDESDPSAPPIDDAWLANEVRDAAAAVTRARAAVEEARSRPPGGAAPSRASPRTEDSAVAATERARAIAAARAERTHEIERSAHALLVAAQADAARRLHEDPETVREQIEEARATLSTVEDDSRVEPRREHATVERGSSSPVSVARRPVRSAPLEARTQQAGGEAGGSQERPETTPRTPQHATAPRPTPATATSAPTARPIPAPTTRPTPAAATSPTPPPMPAPPTAQSPPPARVTPAAERPSPQPRRPEPRPQTPESVAVARAAPQARQAPERPEPGKEKSAGRAANQEHWLRFVRSEGPAADGEPVTDAPYVSSRDVRAPNEVRSRIDVARSTGDSTGDASFATRLARRPDPTDVPVETSPTPQMLQPDPGTGAEARDGAAPERRIEASVTAAPLPTDVHAPREVELPWVSEAPGRGPALPGVVVGPLPESPTPVEPATAPAPRRPRRPAVIGIVAVVATPPPPPALPTLIPPVQDEFWSSPFDRSASEAPVAMEAEADARVSSEEEAPETAVAATEEQKAHGWSDVAVLDERLELGDRAAFSASRHAIGEWGDAVTDMLAARWEVPLELRALGTEGTVVLEFDVARDGTVSNLDIVQSSGVAELDLAALAAVPARLPPITMPDVRTIPLRWTFRTRK